MENLINTLKYRMFIFSHLKKILFSSTVIICLSGINICAQNVSKASFLNEAKQLNPQLSHQTSYPIRLISIKKDVNTWLGWKAATLTTLNQQSILKLTKGDTLILDFGRNMVGYIQGETQTAAKVKIESAEVLAELGDSWEQFPAIFENGYKPEKTWSPYVLDISKTWRLNQRLTFRYIRICALESSNDILLSNLRCDEVSAIPFARIRPLEGFSAKMQHIDLLSQYTLRNCLQEVFEDGPKRDRRLWLGDLRLEALADGVLFKSDSLVKRCLLLFAGSQRDDGFIPACVYTTNGNNPEIGDEMIPDYAMLFGSVLLDYSSNSNDWQLARKLYPIACQQVDSVVSEWLNSKNYLDIHNVWLFVDWSKNLDRQTSEQAIAIYATKSLLKLAVKLGIEKDVVKWEKLSKKLQEAALKNLYDKNRGLFISGPQQQVSWASQIWMILAGVVDKPTGSRILTQLKTETNAIQPGTPYLVHHLVQAYLLCDMDAEAYKLIETYWGGMIDKGADTFWEVYDAENAYKSPYNSHLFNSYCHAWSCTPAWFLRNPLYSKRLKKIEIKN